MSHRLAIVGFVPTFSLAHLEQRLTAVDLDHCDDKTLSCVVSDINHGRRILEGHLARIAGIAHRREQQGNGTPAEEILRSRGEISKREADRFARRALVGDVLPQLVDGLQSGTVRPENVDTVARGLADLSKGEKARLSPLDGEITERSTALPPELFARYFSRLKNNVKDPDEPSTAEKDKAASRVSMGRRKDGMWWLSGELDAERGAEIDAALRAMAKALVGDDPITANARADALHRLTCRRGVGRAGSAGGVRDGGGGAGKAAARDGAAGAGPGDGLSGFNAGGATGGGSTGASSHGGGPTDGDSNGGGGPITHGPGGSTNLNGGRCRHSDDTIDVPLRLGIGYIIDVDTLLAGPHPNSVAETWAGDRYDPRAIQRLACDTDWYGVQIGPNGQLQPVGGARRAATRNQRLALRALYRGCPIDGTPFDRCEIHHLTPFGNGGATDIDNLVPISIDWHHRIHDRQWHLTLKPDRSLELRRPDGALHRSIPPPEPITRQRE